MPSLQHFWTQASLPPQQPPPPQKKRTPLEVSDHTAQIGQILLGKMFNIQLGFVSFSLVTAPYLVRIKQFESNDGAHVYFDKVAAESYGKLDADFQQAYGVALGGWHVHACHVLKVWCLYSDQGLVNNKHSPPISKEACQANNRNKTPFQTKLMALNQKKMLPQGE